MERQWDSFAAELNHNLDAFGKQVAAQRKAWQDATGKLESAATEFARERRTAIEGAVQQMKADARKVGAQLQKLVEARNESWSALTAALSHSRAAVDRVVQVAGDALKRATGGGSEKHPGH